MISQFIILTIVTCTCAVTKHPPCRMLTNEFDPHNAAGGDKKFSIYSPLIHPIEITSKMPLKRDVNKNVKCYNEVDDMHVEKHAENYQNKTVKDCKDDKDNNDKYDTQN